MSERIVDPARQGESDIGPKKAWDAPQISYQEALEYHERFAWKTIRGKGDRAREAMVAEVERLRRENGDARELAERQIKAWRDAFKAAAAESAKARAASGDADQQTLVSQRERDEARAEVGRLQRMLVRALDYEATATKALESLRAALPALIACVHDEGIACTRHEYGWGVCCAIRLRMIKAGIIDAPEKRGEQGDGA